VQGGGEWKKYALSGRGSVVHFLLTRPKKAHAKPGAAPGHHWVFALPQLHIAVLQSLLGKTTSWRDRETQKDLCNMEIHGIPKGSQGTDASEGEVSLVSDLSNLGINVEL
jgi:hypothetical protein